jgi:hypothetical protein
MFYYEHPAFLVVIGSFLFAYNAFYVVVGYKSEIA